jgi:hypothetical protein
MTVIDQKEGRATMRARTLRNSAWKIAALGIAVAVAGCGNSGGGLSGPGNTTGDGWNNTNNNNPGGAPGGGTPGAPAKPGSSGNASLDSRVLDYGEALRSASLKLVGDLPTLAEINAVKAGGKANYEAKIDSLLADPRFGAKQIAWWKDTLKTGNQGTPAMGAPDFDTAATFAASVVVGDRPYTDLFTASTGTCPTYTSGSFAPGNCAGTGPTAGLLTDAGLMSQYFANMAFRRVRFVQETFVCSKYPTEFGSAPKPMGSGAYTSPWDFNSITGGTTARINFQDTSAVICANCHTTMNHQAPLFAHFDANVAFNAAIQVKTPSAGNPTAVLADWLPTGQAFYWRSGGAAVTDIPGLGAEIAKDPAVARCAVNRIWNFAMSRGDIVNDLASIPDIVTDPLVKDFTDNGFKMKRLLRNVFTSDDFVKF